MNEPHRSITVDQVNWGGVLLITRLGRALSLSLSPNRIIMGFVFVAILMATGSIWDGLFGSPVGPGRLDSAPVSQKVMDETLGPIVRNPSLVSAERAAALTEAGALSPAAVRGAIEATYRARPAEEREAFRADIEPALMNLRLVEPRGVFAAALAEARGRTGDMLRAALGLNCSLVVANIAGLLQIPATLLSHHTLFAFIFGAWALLVVLIGTAAISRSAACQFALEQYIPWTTALAFALKRWIAIVGAPGLPLAGLALGAVALAIGGLLLAVPGLNIIGAVLYGLALAGSAIAACLILLTLFAGALFVPAVAVESADAPDALARAFSFVRNRPLHWVVYVVAAFVQGLFGLAIVSLIAAITLNFAAWGAGLILSSPAVEAVGGGATITQLLPEDKGWMLSGSHRLAGSLIALWRTVAAGLVAGWALSYYSSATTVLYFLMRKATDDQDLEEIWQPGLIEGTMAPGRVDAGDDAESV